MTPKTNFRFITATFCAGLLVATAAAQPARADGNDLARALIGLTALGLIGAAILDAQKSREPRAVSPPVSVTRVPLVASSTGRYVTPHSSARRYHTLPARCLRNVRLAGVKRLYDAKCVKDSATGPLPKTCKVEIRRGKDKVKGYLPRCLARRGWRS